MARIKIPDVNATIKDRPIPQISGLTIPIGYAEKIGEGIGSIGKVVSDIYKEQKTLQDQTELNDVIKDVEIDLQQKSISAQKNSNLKFAIDAFDKSTKYENYENFLEGKNNQVKNAFQQWLNKTKRSEYGTIASTVTKNHIADGKRTFEDKLDKLSLDQSSSDLVKASNAKTDFNSEINKIQNRALYSKEEFNKLIEEKKLQTTRFQTVFGAKNHPNYVINNYENIKQQLGPNGESLAKQALETAKFQIISDNTKDKLQQDYIQEFNNKTKIQTFAAIIKSLQNDPTPETIGSVPTLSTITELKKNDKLNSAQYDALIDLVKNPKKLSDNDILDRINGQILIADSVEELDALQKQVHLSPEYLGKLGIKDVTKISNIIEKSKDRQVFQDYKHYLKVINNSLGKIDNGFFALFGPNEKTDQKLRTTATRLYQDYIDAGDKPEDAYMKVLKGYMLQQNRVPTIFDTNEISSIKITKPDKVTLDSQKPDQIFNNWRSLAMEAYRNGVVDAQQLKKDLDNLSLMEKVYQVRSTIVGIDPWDDKQAVSTATAGK